MIYLSILARFPYTHLSLPYSFVIHIDEHDQEINEMNFIQIYGITNSELCK